MKPLPETIGAVIPVAASVADAESNAGSASPVTVMSLYSEILPEVVLDSEPLDEMATMAAPPMIIAMIAPTMNLPLPEDDLLMTAPFVCWEG
ncbi:hypothetical protein LBMAG07_13840 [Actinomycetes bacterium]|nr:hypothetical protein LBMAG07_13840 [Actinomycetes bacterium]